MSYDSMMLLEALSPAGDPRVRGTHAPRGAGGHGTGVRPPILRQEAVAVGACMNLLDSRLHREHAPRTRSLHRQGLRHRRDAVEIYGSRGGLCHGKGGSMHIADSARACSARTRSSAADRRSPSVQPSPAGNARDGRVQLAFIGDGASNQGTVFEVHEHGRRPEGARDLRVREQRLQRAHGRAYHLGADIADRAAASACRP